MITQAIRKLMEQQDLTAEETAKSFEEIMTGTATQAQMAAFLMGLKIKGETPLEITECARIMREQCNAVEPKKEVLEIVGTGGDQVGTFNISTASAIVCAAGGVPTAKHGNRSVSSKCGASEVLESLGVKIDLNKEENEKVLEDIDLCFLYAPVYHSAMKYVAPVRQDLGIPTIFNILGPIANPANATKQILGVFSEDLLMPMAEALSNLGVTSGAVVHGSDGLDEITLTGPTKVIYIDNGTLTESTIYPQEYNLETCEIEDLIGGDAEENAQIIRDIFNGEKGPKRDVVLLNSGVGFKIAGKTETIQEGIKLAEEIIDSGKALEKLNEFVEKTNQ